MLRHCSIEELIDVRNGEGSMAARTHVDECQECRDELDQLHQRIAALRALPSFTAPRDRWPVVREAVVAGRRRVWWMRSAWAAAAGLALFLGANGVMRGWPAAAEPERVGTLEALVEESSRLDSLLLAVDAQRRVVNGLTALAIADLEDKIEVIDSRILMVRGAPTPRQRDSQLRDQLVNLMRERVVLMDALVNTHVQRAAYVGF